MSTSRKASTRNPIQLLLRIPVPWVFVLTYIIGAGLEHALPPPAANGRWPGVSVAGAVLFGIGATIAGCRASPNHGQCTPNTKAASTNRRSRFAFDMQSRFDYCFCAQPSLSAAVGEPQR
jgi:hypothetical protein